MSNRRVLVASFGHGAPGTNFADLPEAGDVLLGPDGNLISVSDKPVLFSGGVTTEYSTISAAMAAASSGDIVVTPPGSFTEQVIVPAGVNLFGPMTEIVGSGGLGLTRGVVEVISGLVHLKKVTPGAGESGIVKVDSAGTARVLVDQIDAQATGCIGALNIALASNGELILITNQIDVGANSIGVGSATVGEGNTHVDFNCIYLHGNGATAVTQAISADSRISIRGDHIQEEGTPTTTTGLNISAGIADVLILDIFADTAWNVGASGTLNLHYHRVTGTQTETGTVSVSFPGMGARVEALAANPGGARSSTSATFEDIDANLTGVAFTLPTAGTWKIVFRFSGYHNTAAASHTAEYELVFDAGEANEQTWVEDTTGSMQLQHVTATDRKYRSAETALTFTSGSHTVGVKWVRRAGAQSIGASGSDHFNVVMTRIR
jgi:hypothetical protein